MVALCCNLLNHRLVVPRCGWSQTDGDGRRTSSSSMWYLACARGGASRCVVCGQIMCHVRPIYVYMYGTARAHADAHSSTPADRRPTTRTRQRLSLINKARTRSTHTHTQRTQSALLAPSFLALPDLTNQPASCIQRRREVNTAARSACMSRRQSRVSTAQEGARTHVDVGTLAR